MERGLQWRWMFRENVGYYQNQVVRIDDTDFVLSTLWSRVNPNNEYFVWKGMNDFRQIKFDGKLLQVEEFNWYQGKYGTPYRGGYASPADTSGSGSAS